MLPFQNYQSSQPATFQASIFSPPSSYGYSPPQPMSLGQSPVSLSGRRIDRVVSFPTGTQFSPTSNEIIGLFNAWPTAQPATFKPSSTGYGPMSLSPFSLGPEFASLTVQPISSSPSLMPDAFGNPQGW